jgi:serine/threonine protein phosphatase PrpC
MTNDIQYWGQTDVGLMRKSNEDCFGFFGGGGHRLASSGGLGPADPLIAIVCDGVGGHEAGELASALVTSSVGAALGQWASGTSLFEEENFNRQVQHLLQGIDQSLATFADEQNHEKKAATTLTAAWFHDHQVSIINVGDSRTYRYRRGELTQLTIDDTEAGKAVAAGRISESEARKDPRKHILQKAIGSGSKDYTSATQTLRVEPGDIYLLCSDGLSDGLNNDQLAKALAHFESNPDGDFLTKLIEAANRASGKDNITVALIQIGEKWSGLSRCLPQLDKPKTLSPMMFKASLAVAGAITLVLALFIWLSFSSLQDTKKEWQGSLNKLEESMDQRMERLQREAAMSGRRFEDLLVALRRDFERELGDLRTVNSRMTGELKELFSADMKNSSDSFNERFRRIDDSLSALRGQMGETNQNLTNRFNQELSAMGTFVAGLNAKIEALELQQQKAAAGHELEEEKPLEQTVGETEPPSGI